MNTQLKKGVLELCVLATLCYKECYGYELVNILSAGVEVTEGTIYPILKRLRDDGYVTTYISEESEGPPRKYYQITNSGRDTKTQLHEEWVQFNLAVNKILDGEQND